MVTRKWLIWLVVLAYLVAGVLYAVFTPAWQVPDEPAHYNYVRYIASHGRFPVLEKGDYPARYLEEIKSRRFPADMSIGPIRYEFHQPPLYYLLQVPVFIGFGGQILPLRIFSLLLGALLLLVIYRALADLFPDRRWVALMAAAFVAVLPMHTAMMAGVENDSLAELLLAIAMWFSIRLVLEFDEPNARSLGRLGIVLGLILVTKTTVYVAVPIALLALIPVGKGRWRLRGWLEGLGRVLVPMLLIALPWYARNAVVYGWPDFLGLRRHDSVVIGQPRTVDWILRFGWHQYLHRYVTFTFDSFWGVFGWLGVFMDRRIYLFLEMLSAAVLLGLLVALFEALVRKSPGLSKKQWFGIGMLVLLFFGVVAEYVGYNLMFVQHQGRYLFPSLMAIGAGWAVGLRKTTSGRTSMVLSVAFLALAVVFAVAPGACGKWGVLLAALFASFFFAIWVLGKRKHWAPWAGIVLVYAVLYAVEVLAVFAFIVPQLAR